MTWWRPGASWTIVSIVSINSSPPSTAYMRQWIVPDNGCLTIWCQAIIYTYSGSLSIGPLWTNFSGILVKNRTFSLKKMPLKMSSAICRQFCPGLSVRTNQFGGQYELLFQRSATPYTPHLIYLFCLFNPQFQSKFGMLEAWHWLETNGVCYVIGRIDMKKYSNFISV